MRPYKNAFTLIELLVVITVIVLLVGILVPSVISARNSAYVATTKTLIFTLESGLNLYKNDFGSYPPSQWDVNSGGDPYRATHSGSNFTLPPIMVSGAQTLVWAMVGADFRGTPGFGGNLQTLYALDAPNGNPVSKRSPKFIDAERAKIGAVAETELGDAGFTGVYPELPMFLDNFNMPILYYKADTSQSMLTRYNPVHNSNIVADATKYADNSGEPLPTFDLSKGDNFLGYNQGTKEFAPPAGPTASLNGYLTDKRLKKLTGQDAPYNKDSFILISAGIDRVYGTGDDIVNFQRQD